MVNMRLETEVTRSGMIQLSTQTALALNSTNSRENSAKLSVPLEHRFGKWHSYKTSECLAQCSGIHNEFLGKLEFVHVIGLT